MTKKQQMSSIIIQMSCGIQVNRNI